MRRPKNTYDASQVRRVDIQDFVQGPFESSSINAAPPLRPCAERPVANRRVQNANELRRQPSGAANRTSATVSRTPRSRIRGAERTACPSGLTVAASSARLAGPRSAASTAARPPTCFRKCSSICGARCDRGANCVSLDTPDRRAACDVRHARCGCDARLAPCDAQHATQPPSPCVPVA